MYLVCWTLFETNYISPITLLSNNSSISLSAAAVCEPQRSMYKSLKISKQLSHWKSCATESFTWKCFKASDSQKTNLCSKKCMLKNKGSSFPNHRAKCSKNISIHLSSSNRPPQSHRWKPELSTNMYHTKLSQRNKVYGHQLNFYRYKVHEGPWTKFLMVQTISPSPCWGSSTHWWMITRAPLFSVWCIDIIILTHLVRICCCSKPQTPWPALPIDTPVRIHPSLWVWLQVCWRRNACSTLPNRLFTLIDILLIVMIRIGLCCLHWPLWRVHLSDLFEEFGDSVKNFRGSDSRRRDDGGDVKGAHRGIWDSTSNLHFADHTRDQARREEWIWRWGLFWYLWGLSNQLTSRGNWQGSRERGWNNRRVDASWKLVWWKRLSYSRGVVGRKRSLRKLFLRILLIGGA